MHCNTFDEIQIADKIYLPSKSIQGFKMNWIKYWGAGLADAESINIKISAIDSKYKPEFFDLNNAKLPQHLFEIFWPKKELDALFENKVVDKEILISQLSLVPKLSHTKAKTNDDAISPFWIPAIITSQNELKPGNKEYPLIPRNILEPVVKKDIVFSTVDRVDEVLAKAEINKDNWLDYYVSVQKVFQDITGQTTNDYQSQEFFEVKQQLVIIPDDLVVGASYHILELYTKLSKQTNYPALLKTIIEEKTPAIQNQYSATEVFTHSATHFGQMNNGFGLSPSQRKALNHFLGLKHGEVLAVNGPPGTGKTTLIQSVIADNFIKAAISGGDPMITIASSTNNQAITNIIDSFSKGKPASLLEERWLDQINSFALYMVSSDAEKIKKSKEKKWLYHSSKNVECSLSAIETNDYVTKATANFIHKLSTYANTVFTTINPAQDYLQNQVKWYSEKIKESTQQWKEFVSIKEALLTYKNYTEQDLSNISDAFFTREISENNNLIARLLEAKQKEPFYYLFSFIKSIKERKRLYYQLVFNECGFDTSEWDFSSSSRLQVTLLSKAEVINTAAKNFNAFHFWKNQVQELQTESFSITENDDSFLNKIDTKIRFKNFYYAVHYWEARWITATGKVLEDNTNWKNTKSSTIERLQRFAMLCPCFVSTFHMLPKMMQYTEYPSKQINHLFDFIDLLIVDESGQVSPEIGVPSFSFAKKALIVGDNYQIEPVWNVDGKTDEGNLIKYGLYQPGKPQRMEELIKKGYLSSNGSLMKLAQKSCSFQFKKDERGLLLTEHRRCLDQIIGYCNELVYDNQLQPMSSLKYNIDDFLPPMGFLQIQGKAEKEGGSRVNYLEAAKLVEWLKLNETQIINWVYLKEQQESKNPAEIKKKQLHDLVGIITPFTAQKKHLTRSLNLNGYQTSLFQYGTVHSLQGAEKDIVLFSPVYTSDLQTGYFFDMGPNMLNVAVSRAKRSFIVAGDIAIFRKGSKKTPSGLLGKYLKEEVKR